MRRKVIRTLAAAAAAGGAALLTAGLAGPAAAAGPRAGEHPGTAAASAAGPRAGGHTAAYPVIDTASQAGYTASGRWMRFVATTVKVPASGPYASYAEVVLGGATVGPVTLAVRPGGGPASVGWSVGVPPFGMGGGTLTKVDPAVGDTVLIDLYYDRSGGGVVATATDRTTGRTQSFAISTGTRAVFTAAEVASVLANPSAPPASDIRLWQLTDSAITTYTGVHGTITGPWTTSEVIDTTTGGSSGQVVMSPSFLFAGGHDFGAWLRAWLR